MDIDKNIRVLVVDDMASIRKLEVKILKELGFDSVEEAEDGAIAWDMIIKETQSGSPFGLIVSDINMPQVNGITLLQHVRGNQKLASTPFLIVSSENELPVVMQAIKAGASNYITKPLTKEQLEEKITRIFADPKYKEAKSG